MVSEQAPAAEVVEGSDTAAPAPVESEEAAPKAEEQQKEDEAPVVVEDVKEGEDEDDDDDDDDDEADEGNVCACLPLPTLHAADCKVQNCR
jgi:nascent polypeptide-associated complex subunit alpha